MPAKKKSAAAPHRPAIALASICLACASLGGCAELFYSRTKYGAFSGKLTVEWIAPNQFIYRPDPRDPLKYVTADGRTIRPQLMYTDGGSIPRLFWSTAAFGPWDFAPGYIIHDWLFTQHRCQLGDWQQYDFQSGALILAEGIKAQMEKVGQPEPGVVYTIYNAVRSPIAQRLWNKSGCETPPADDLMFRATAAPVVIMRIEAK